MNQSSPRVKGEEGLADDTLGLLIGNRGKQISFFPLKINRLSGGQNNRPKLSTS